MKPNTWGTLRRRWQTGDVVTVRFPLHARLVPVDPQHSQRVAVMYGPLMMAQPHTMLSQKRAYLPGDRTGDWDNAEGSRGQQSSNRGRKAIQFPGLVRCGRQSRVERVDAAEDGMAAHTSWPVRGPATKQLLPHLSTAKRAQWPSGLLIGLPESWYRNYDGLPQHRPMMSKEARLSGLSAGTVALPRVVYAA